MPPERDECYQIYCKQNRLFFSFLFWFGLFIVIYYIFVSLSNRPVCLPTFIIVFAHAHTLLFERDAESKNKKILKNEILFFFFFHNIWKRDPRTCLKSMQTSLEWKAAMSSDCKVTWINSFNDEYNFFFKVCKKIT